MREGKFEVQRKPRILSILILVNCSMFFSLYGLVARAGCDRLEESDIAPHLPIQ